MSEICSIARSTQPGMGRSTWASSCDLASSTSNSSPNSFNATSAFTPEIISLMRCSIGWVNQIVWPGMSCTSRYINSTNASCVSARVQSYRGLSDTKMSVSSMLPASVATAGAPTRLQMCAISSGNAFSSTRSICVLTRIDSLRLVPGGRMTPITTSPSERRGTNSVPKPSASIAANVSSPAPRPSRAKRLAIANRSSGR